MKTKKIHIALGYLSLYELKDFKKFLDSPFFNQNEIVVKYFNILYNRIREDKPLDTLENEEVWRQLFDGLSYNDAKFRKLNLDISKRFENYCAYKELSNDPTQLNSLKIRAFKNKNMKALYPALIKHIDTSKKTQNDRSADYYLNLFNIEKEIFGLESDADRKSKSKDPVRDLNIEKISINLDVFYIAEKLKYYCAVLSWKRSYKVDIKIAGIEFILKLASIDLFKDYPPIKIYYTISKTIKEENNLDHYFKLKGLIDKHIHLFPPDEAKEIMDAAISYCVVKMNKGVDEFTKETFLLYKKGLENELIYNDEFISPVTYRNIAILGMRANDLEWTLNFIEEFAVKLKEEHRSNAYYFSLARLAFYEKDFNKVIDLLYKVELIDVFYNLSVRTILVVAYYEKGEWMALDSLLQSFNAWVGREKSMTKEKKSEYTRMIRYVKRLVNTPDFEKQKLQKLYNDLDSTSAVVSKSWVLSKINEKIDQKG